MKKHQLILIVLAACITVLTPLQAQQIQGKILQVNGTAEVNIPGQGTQKLVVGSLVPVGSEITTGEDSSVMVGLTQGAGVVVEENTELGLDELSVEKKDEKVTKREVQLNLKNDKGSALSFLKNFDGATDYKVKTATAVAAARGTVWRTTQATVQVVAGNVQVIIGGLTVDVPAGSAFTNAEGVTTMTQGAIDAIVKAVEDAGGQIDRTGPDGPEIILPGEARIPIDETDSDPSPS